MQIGDTLNERYLLTAHLGSGAMGEVYQATDSQTKQTVAVKILDRKLTLDPEIVERFKREGEALRQLRHRHIVSFVDTFQHEGQQVIVMEYVAGGSLHQLIQRGPLPVEQARQVAIDLCDALTSAHRLNIIHRDVKPDNVLVGADGAPKLTDFGVARLVSEGTRLTGTGTQIGTPFYMSPEAWQGQPLDAQADVWSLGIMLYEMLTGDVPFGGDTLVSVMNKVLTAPLPDLKRLRPDTPPGLVKIVRRMLERDRAKRYQSLREVGLDLDRMPVAPAHAPVASASAGLASASAASAPASTASASVSVPPVPVTARERPSTRPPSPGDNLAGGALASGRARWAFGLGGLALAIVLCLLAVGGGALALKLIGPAATATSRPTETAAPPTDTPLLPTPTPLPSDTPAPSATPLPSDTAAPTVTLAAPTSTPRPSQTPVPVPTATRKPQIAPSPLPPTPTAGTMFLVLHNNSAFPVAHVYFACGAGGGWSGEQITAPVPAGGSTNWEISTAIWYCSGAGMAFKAEDEAHQLLGQQTNIWVTGTYDWYIVP